MIVKFDFRPEILKNPPRKKTRKIFVFMSSLFIIFCVILSAAAFFALKDIFVLHDAIISLSQRVNNFEKIRGLLLAEVGKLKKEEAQHTQNLAIISNELPSIEILNAIEKSLPDTITLLSLSANTGGVSMSGSANTEEDIVFFTQTLKNSGVCSSTQAPVATRTGNAEHGIKFSLALTPLKISEIKHE